MYQNHPYSGEDGFQENQEAFVAEIKGKALADLRNKEIKDMLLSLERRRDALYDEIANSKGQVEVIEEVIKEIYDRIININKEVQQQELKDGVEKKAKEEERKKQEESDAFAVAKRGIKTPKLKKPRRRKKSEEK